MPDDLRWSWCVSDRSKSAQKCSMLDSPWDHASSFPGPWKKSCLPWNQPLVPERLKTAGVRCVCVCVCIYTHTHTHTHIWIAQLISLVRSDWVRSLSFWDTDSWKQILAETLKIIYMISKKMEAAWTSWLPQGYIDLGQDSGLLAPNSIAKQCFSILTSARRAILGVTKSKCMLVQPQ